MKIYDMAVIGAGPAGLFAAATASEAGLSVCIAEANRSPGLKLLVSGQGKCNITNSEGLPGMLRRYGKREHFVRKCLYAFTDGDLRDFFSRNSLRLVVREDGKVFPETESARDVLNCLLSLCTKSDVEIMYCRRVTRISAHKDFFRLYSGTDHEHFAAASSLLIASGGMSYPSTGSRGDGFRLAENFGHKVIKPRPSLSPVRIFPDTYRNFSECAGITVSCGIRLFRDGTKLHAFGSRKPGIMLFTHKGLSGPIIIDNSRDFLSGDELEINLLPRMKPEEAGGRLLSFCDANGKSGVKKFFTGEGIPDRLASAVIANALSLPSASETGDIKCAELTALNRRRISEAFTGLRFGISEVEGFKKAMCTAGGIDTREINPATMESRLQPGLFFAGEVIDVDGDSGGYNLQFAFSSAASAARGIIERNY